MNPAGGGKLLSGDVLSDMSLQVREDSMAPSFTCARPWSSSEELTLGPDHLRDHRVDLFARCFPFVDTIGNLVDPRRRTAKATDRIEAAHGSLFASRCGTSGAADVARERSAPM
jgi:hypothetical protein